MARDYAKQRNAPRRGPQAGRRAPPAARKKPAGKSSGSGNWRWFSTGVITGVFLSFLVYLGMLPRDTGPAEQATAKPQADAAPQPRFDFYTMLPEQSLDDEEHTAKEPVQAQSAAQSGVYYLLQAGSFRHREDADRRRAELLLLGLDPSVQESDSDNGHWFRVYLGPFDSHGKMTRARSLTAAQGIDTLLLKRPTP